MGRTLWVVLALLVGCALGGPASAQTAPPAPERVLPASPSAGTSTAAACRTGPNGEADATATTHLADRGIGGTGVTPAPAGPPVMQADRGIGGTGVVGVVTGFASICLSGREVALSDDTPVVMDGAPANLATLRAGQLTAVEATGPDTSLQARRIAIRHEVSGPVEEIGTDGVIRVAGQRVKIGPHTWGAGPLAVGDWLAVSGLRAFDGAIEATRIDRRGPGEILVHGLLVRDGPLLRIGALEIRPQLGGPNGAPATTPVLIGASVTAVGRYSNGILYADTLDTDLLLADPVVYFGPAVSVFVVEGYTTLSGGRLRIGPQFGLRAPAALPGFGAARAIAEFRRSGDGTIALTALRQPGSRPGTGRDLLTPRGALPGSSRGFAPGSPRTAPPRAIPQRFGGPEFGGPRFGGPAPSGLRPTNPHVGGPRFEPAPVPNHGFGRPGAGQGFRSERQGGARRGANEFGPGGPGVNGPGTGFGPGGGGFGGGGFGNGGGFGGRR